MYLAVIIDLYSREVVGWSMQPHMKAELVADAIRMARFRRRLKPAQSCIATGPAQYASRRYRELVSQYLMTMSKSRRANALG